MANSLGFSSNYIVEPTVFQKAFGFFGTPLWSRSQSKNLMLSMFIWKLLSRMAGSGFAVLFILALTPL